MELHFSNTCVAARIKCCNDLLKLLESTIILDEEQFFDLMYAAFHLIGLDHKRMATDLGYNISTVTRWKYRRACPNISKWANIIGWIKSALTEKINISSVFLDKKRYSQEEIISLVNSQR